MQIRLTAGWGARIAPTSMSERVDLYNNVYAALQGEMSADEAASKMNEEIQKALETF